MQLNNWNTLSKNDKTKYLDNLIKKIDLDFKFLKIKSFKYLDNVFETGVLEYDGSEFVFIPGMDNALLGWDTKYDNEIHQYIETDLKIVKNPLLLYSNYLDNTKNREYKAYYKEQIEAINDGTFEFTDFIKENCIDLLKLQNYFHKHVSPVRRVAIPSLIVECKLNKVQSLPRKILGEFDINEKKTNLNLEKTVLKEIEIGICLKSIGITIPGKYRIYLSQDQSKYYICEWSDDIIQYDEIINELNKQGFTLMNENQWEYVCGATATTLFRWGNVIEENLIFGGKKAKQNYFGLEIASDQYKRELILSKEITKGGDGGESLDGTAEINLLFPRLFPLSTFYREPFESKENLVLNSKIKSFNFRRAIVLSNDMA